MTCLSAPLIPTWLLFALLIAGESLVADRFAAADPSDSDVSAQSIDEVDEWEEDDVSQP